MADLPCTIRYLPSWSKATDPPLGPVEVAKRWHFLCEGRILAGVQALLAASDGHPWIGDMTPAETLADLEALLVAACTYGPPPTEEPTL